MTIKETLTEKKKWYKKWWIWILLSILTIGIIGGTVKENTLDNNPVEKPIIESTENNAMADRAPDVLKSAPIEFMVVSYDQDFLGGNTILVWIKNLTFKNISWVEYTLCFYNIKGELLCDTLRGYDSMTWYDGPIAPNERISINGGTFYNSHFRKTAVARILIHYEDNTEELITHQDLVLYETIIVSPETFMVYTSKNAASYHTEGCDHYLNNDYDMEVSLFKAWELGKVKCQHCLP